MSIFEIVLLLGMLAIIYVLLSRQLKVIHDLVNSNLTKVKADLEIALNRIEILETILTAERDKH